MLKSLSSRLAAELAVRESQVAATIELIDGGATVPFIARYRKEVTGGLDDTQLRTLAERLVYLREMDDRRDSILKSIAEQGKLTPELEAALYASDNKTTLEDLYLPYKPKRRTKAQIAREAGLEPLADSLLADPSQDPNALAETYINAEAGVADAKAALDGARAILIERFAEDAELLGQLREKLWNEGELAAAVVAGKESEGAKFSDYFDHREHIKAIPSHRALALLRGRNEGVLSVALKYQPDETPITERSAYEMLIAARFGIKDAGRAADKWLLDGVRLCWRAKIFLSLELELVSRLKDAADGEAIKVFAANLHDLLLAAPAGRRATLGLDPGLRTGCKVAVVDDTGKVLDTATIYPHEPRREWDKSIAILGALCARHKVDLIAIGNGTASRETDKLAQDLIKAFPQLSMTKIVVSEAGASVYSASELAAKEFPDMDVSLRGAVSIARRLQDPLAELVKIDPKSIGVGQYQHDVNQSQLARALDGVVEDCVNAVGVDVNTASVPLLTRISGLNATLASNIVSYRDQNGAFRTRKELLKVPRLGDKTFEQAAGFLRIAGGDNPLDASSVHPEAYPVVEKIVAKAGRDVKSLIGDSAFLKSVRAADYTDERFGLPTVMDILKELDKPGRDPRPEFKTATFQDGVEDIKHLQPGMVLEGVVTNVANFGAFVDIGVHQDGLVHISALSNKFIDDPRKVVKAGDVVKVKVLEVDVARKRIALTMRLDDEVGSGNSRGGRGDSRPRQQRGQSSAPQGDTAMAAAFAKLRKG
ncbi:Tex family protein [Chromobacterium violaceum]|uniref:Tex family protein n=1 Tax=Chromobacterium violaceum TaxID=536 RepID=UPI0009D984FE|nr:Tex family protein [Chromobacterium violaceum]MBX9268569.1 RNA-binding transcriptional accessory protein [Chromobacterium violaceum]OQS45275.1 RNA-binding transcriptional accessory protein [Chromobacterium violaceum]OQS48152.1 RNA-binding transcriptional accessory protein [Chromobacterium violaceum]QRO34783.1 RNA-binding transcriptional accessory protein [Chromobacterium violaceum]QRQ15412.1 RNA-binding transcriptional accessory protein [Chromobacterium violaceum]